MTDATKPAISDARLRELAATLHERYGVAARIARATWPAAGTSSEAMVAATATVFIELNRQLGSNIEASAPSVPAATHGAGEAPTTCPKCGGPISAVEKKHARMPDFRCNDRACDTPIWLRSRKAAAR